MSLDSSTPPASIETLLPPVESSVFADRPASRFAAGVLAVGDTVYHSAELLAYHQLRANVFAEEQGYLSLDAVGADGGERDHNDSRSVHLGVLENNDGLTRMVGSMRLILKNSGQPLPSETYFPEVFDKDPAHADSVEISRFIGRHPDRRIQEKLMWPLMQAALEYGRDHNLGPAYAILEQKLARKLKIMGLPFAKLAELKYIEDYRTSNMPVRISPNEVAGVLADHAVSQPGQRLNGHRAFTYFGAVSLRAA